MCPLWEDAHSLSSPLCWKQMSMSHKTHWLEIVISLYLSMGDEASEAWLHPCTLKVQQSTCYVAHSDHPESFGLSSHLVAKWQPSTGCLISIHSYNLSCQWSTFPDRVPCTVAQMTKKDVTLHTPPQALVFQANDKLVICKVKWP